MKDITQEQAIKLLEFVKKLASMQTEAPFQEEDYMDACVADYVGSNVDDAAEWGGRCADYFISEDARAILGELGLRK